MSWNVDINKNIVNAVAGQLNPSSTYKAGDRVWDEGKLYEAKVDSSVQGWTWTETKVVDEYTEAGKPWDKTNAYYYGDIVQVGNNMYKCVASSATIGSFIVGSEWEIYYTHNEPNIYWVRNDADLNAWQDQANPRTDYSVVYIEEKSDGSVYNLDLAKINDTTTKLIKFVSNKTNPIHVTLKGKIFNRSFEGSFYVDSCSVIDGDDDYDNVLFNNCMFNNCNITHKLTTEDPSVTASYDHCIFNNGFWGADFTGIDNVDNKIRTDCKVIDCKFNNVDVDITGFNKSQTFTDNAFHNCDLKWDTTAHNNQLCRLSYNVFFYTYEGMDPSALKENEYGRDDVGLFGGSFTIKGPSGNGSAAYGALFKFPNAIGTQFNINSWNLATSCFVFVQVCADCVFNLYLNHDIPTGTSKYEKIDFISLLHADNVTAKLFNSENHTYNGTIVRSYSFNSSSIVVRMSNTVDLSAATMLDGYVSNWGSATVDRTTGKIDAFSNIYRLEPNSSYSLQPIVMNPTNTRRGYLSLYDKLTVQNDTGTGTGKKYYANYSTL